MCDFCKKDSGFDYKLVGITVITACPNCITSNLVRGTFPIPEGSNSLMSEISGHHGAILIYTDELKKAYAVDRFEAVRLLAHQLMPNEYKKILDNHSANDFDLHDDFYSDSGLAYQPLLEDKYFSELNQYADDYNDKNAKKYAEMYYDDLENQNDINKDSDYETEV